MSKRKYPWITLSILCSLLVSACGGLTPFASSGGDTQESERLAVRTIISSIWRDLASSERSVACMGYATSGIIDGTPAVGALGMVLSDGSLAAFDQQIVTSEWRSLLDSTCAGVAEKLEDEARETLTASTDCEIGVYEGVKGTVKDKVPAASCSLDRRGGKFKLEFCVPKAKKWKRIQVGYANLGVPVPDATSKVEDGRLICPGRISEDFWTFTVPYPGSGSRFVLLTGQNMRKKIWEFSVTLPR